MLLPERRALALRAFSLTERALSLERVRQREAYVRERVLARAHLDLAPEPLARDPATALKRALSRHENLLSGYENARARAWVEATPKEALADALSSLLFDETPLIERLDTFLSLSSPQEITPQRLAHVNETVASYLLAMSDPATYAFVKLESAFQPAYRLLVHPLGERADASLSRLPLATELYRELRDLWREHADFQGDLLDVHTRLFILGSGAYPEFSWAHTLSPQELSSLVSPHLSPAWLLPFQDAAEQMRECCVDVNRPQDPFHGLLLDDYAHLAGQSTRTLAQIVEHGSRELARISLDSADAFGLSLARDGSWRVAAQDGASRDEAEAFFETRVKPSLQELAAVARLMRGELADVELSLLVAEPYRALDGKILLLTLCALDPDWTWHHFFPLLTSAELSAAAQLLGLEPLSIASFPDFLDAQFALRAALHAHTSLPAGALTTWLREHELGRYLFQMLGSSEEEGALLDEEAQETLTSLHEEEAQQHANRLDRAAPQTISLEPPRTITPRVEDDWSDFIAAIFDVRHERLARLLRARRNVVLYGPPGTGKTVISTQLATLWRRWQHDTELDADEPSVEQVTFHPSYGYEEFIEGFRPRPERPGEFVLTDGILSRMAERAQRQPHRCFLLLIDELNRGDVARIFGELITLIEADKRSPEHARRRMLSQRPLWLPPNLYLLATMNTADKSISLLDVAIRRRFAFERVPPQPHLLDRSPGIIHQVQDVHLSAVLSALNARLARLGVYPERWLGHSFLWLDERQIDDPLEAVATRFKLDIIPLVEEYCFADKRQMRAVLGPLVDAQGQPNETLLATPRFLDTLRDLARDAVDPEEDRFAAAGGGEGAATELSSAWRSSHARTRERTREPQEVRYPAPHGADDEP